MAARHDGASETASVVELRRVGVVTGKVASSALPVIVGVSAVASVSTLGFVIGLPLMLLGGLLVTRSSRIVFRADDAGITIRNVAYTRSWSWEDVGEVGWDDSMGRGGGRGLSVGPLHDPYTYVATATARSRPLWSSSDVLFVDEEAAVTVSFRMALTSEHWGAPAIGWRLRRCRVHDRQ